MKQSRVKC